MRVSAPTPSAGAVILPGVARRRGSRRSRPARSSAARPTSPGRLTVTTRLAAPDWSLSSSGVPSAMIRPWSTTTMWSASWSASSRYWVVRNKVVPSRDQVAQHAPELDPAARVEPGGRLVEEQHRRRGDQAGGEVEPAPHATGVVLDHLVARLGQREPLEQLVDRRFTSAPVEAVEVTDQPEVLAAGEQLVDGGGLGGQAHPVAHGIRLGDDVEAGDPGGAAGRDAERGHHPHRRGLARAVGAEHREHRAGGHREADAVDRGEVAERLDEVDRLDGRGAHDTRQNGCPAGSR